MKVLLFNQTNSLHKIVPYLYFLQNYYLHH